MKPELGKQYVISVVLQNGHVLKTLCKFIRVTRTGYNFLNLNTDKCIFKKHWYKSKKTGDFFVPWQVKITEVYKSSLK